MGAESSIEWTTHTHNPWWGCSRVSPGCTHCYAEAFAKRTGHAVWGAGAPRRFFGDEHHAAPLKWNASAVKRGVRERVFCASMADVFEELDGDVGLVLSAERARLWTTIASTPALDWLLLTKRPENMRRMLPAAWLEMPRRNVWLGTTAEDQQRADERIPELLRTPAAVRFVSAEPLLGAVALRPYLGPSFTACRMPDNASPRSAAASLAIARIARAAAERSGGAFVDLVIVGGESGPGARPFNLAWARRILADCKAAGVAAFFKQAGSNAYDDGPLSQEFTSYQQWVDKARSWLASGTWACFDARGRHCPTGKEFARARDEDAFPVRALPRLRLNDRKGGDLAELPVDLRVREMPEVRP